MTTTSDHWPLTGDLFCYNAPQLKHSFISVYIEKKLVPGLTTAHQSLTDEINFVMKSPQNSQGLAIIIDTDTSLRHHGNLFLKTFEYLNFSIFRRTAITKKAVADVLLGAGQIEIGSSASQPTDYPIVVVLTAKIGKNSAYTLRCLDGKIHIRQEVVKPLLPPNAPNLSSSPKIFFINASSPKGYILPLHSLKVPFEGNFLVSLMAMEDSKLKDILSKLQHKITSSEDSSIKDIVSSIGDYQSMKLISRLDKPVSLCHRRLYNKFFGVEAEQGQSWTSQDYESVLDDEKNQLPHIYGDASHFSEPHLFFSGRHHHEYDDRTSTMFRAWDSTSE